MITVCTIIECFDQANRTSSMTEDTELDIDRSQLEMQHSMNESLFFLDDAVLILDNRLSYFDAVHKR